MLNQQTIEKLKSMRLSAMAEHFKKQTESTAMASLSFEERFGMLVDLEYLQRQNNKIKRLLHRAKLRLPQACLEDIDYHSTRMIEKSNIARLSQNSYINENRNIILTGATGTGKTYLACAFGNNACRNGYQVRYYRTNRLLEDLAISRGDGTYNKILSTIKNSNLLILDDFGLSELSPLSARDLLEVIEDRFGIGATIISAQLPVSKWHEVFEDSTIADAILDRVVHNAYRFNLEGPSLRESRNST